LTALNNDGATNSPHRQRITTAIMSASEQQHCPSASKVGALTNELVITLLGRRLSETQLSELSTAIISVLRSAGVGTHAFMQSVSHVEKVLVSGGVRADAAKRVAETLSAVGKEVRGPEGVPARPLE
jgi:hypothetical protein